jgi:hypothetical protein
LKISIECLKILPMKKIAPLLLVAILIAGCSTQTIAVHLTDPRPVVTVQSVTLMLQAPSGSVLIADLTASASNSSEGAQSAQTELKKAAAAVGANVLVINQWNGSDYLSGVDNKFRIEGKAYYAPPENK